MNGMVTLHYMSILPFYAGKFVFSNPSSVVCTGHPSPSFFDSLVGLTSVSSHSVPKHNIPT